MDSQTFLQYFKYYVDCNIFVTAFVLSVVVFLIMLTRCSNNEIRTFISVVITGSRLKLDKLNKR